MELAQAIDRSAANCATKVRNYNESSPYNRQHLGEPFIRIAVGNLREECLRSVASGFQELLKHFSKTEPESTNIANKAARATWEATKEAFGWNDGEIFNGKKLHEWAERTGAANIAKQNPQFIPLRTPKCGGARIPIAQQLNCDFYHLFGSGLQLLVKKAALGRTAAPMPQNNPEGQPEAALGEKDEAASGIPTKTNAVASPEMPTKTDEVAPPGMSATANEKDGQSSSTGTPKTDEVASPGMVTTNAVSSSSTAEESNLEIPATADHPTDSDVSAVAHQSPAKGKKGLLGRYTSHRKRAIVTALTKNPNATDLELCRSIDADATLDDEEMLLETIYQDPKVRPRLQVTFSKVRRKMRDEGLL